MKKFGYFKMQKMINLLYNINMTMTSTLHKLLKPLLILFIFLLTITFSSIAQNKQSYRNHQEIEVGGGMKVEVLTCSGEGPTEICDCIYFSGKRQNGTRMKQNANQLKDEERAALLAKAIKNPEIKGNTLTSLEQNRADKAIPSSIIAKPKPERPQPTLEEAVKRADSIASASSRKMKETMASIAPADDSTEMDRVFIPKATERGKTQLEASSTKPATNNNRADTANKKAKAEVAVTNPASISAKPFISANDSLGKIAPDKVGQQITPPTPGIPASAAKILNQNETTANQIPQIKNGVTTPALASGDTVTSLTGAVRNNPVISTSTVNDNPINHPVDTAQDTWVKQYQHVTAIPEGTKQFVGKSQQSEIGSADTLGVSNVAGLKTEMKNEAKINDSISNKGSIVAAQITDKAGKKSEDFANITATPPVQNNLSIDKNQKDQGKLNQAGQDTASAQDTANISKSRTVKDKAINGKEVFPKVLPSDTSRTLTTPQYPSIDMHNDPVVGTSAAVGHMGSLEKEGSPLSTNSIATTSNIIGKSAEVNAKGEWEKVTIIDKETEFLYKVHYLGSSSDHDEWVPVSQIRNIDSMAPPSITGNSTPHSEKPLNKLPKTGLNCSFEAPAPPVANGDKFSEKLAKRKIYEQCVAINKSDNTIKTGVTFLSLETESPYVNTISISPTNTLDIKVSFAPAGAMIYPVKTEYKVCEQISGKTSSKTVSSNYACYRNKEGAWTCTIFE